MNNYHVNLLAKTTALLGCLACAALVSAQTAQPPQTAQSPLLDPAAQLLQNLNKTTLNNALGTAPEILQDAQTRKRLAPPAAGGKAMSIDVRGFKVSGITAKPSFDTRKILAPHIGSNRSFDQLTAAAEELQTALRQDGYFLAQVDIPQQSISEGIVELRVIQGYLDTIELKPIPAGVRANREQILGILDRHLKAGQVIRTKDLEHALFLVSDLSAILVESVIETGTKPGTAKLIIGISAGSKHDSALDFDNYGSRFTGEYRLGLSTSVNAPTDRGDLFKLSGMASTNAGTQYLRAAYQAPVGSSGLKLGVALSTLKYRLGTATFAPLDQTGAGSSASLFSIYPVIRSRNLSTFVQASIERSSGEDVRGAFGVHNESHSWVKRLSVIGDSRDNWGGGGINSFTAGVVSGRLSIDTASLLEADQAANGRQVNGNYAKLIYGLARQQQLGGSTGQSNNRLALYTALQGQVAAQNLNGGEKIALGGATGIRAYAPGEASGDAGHIFTWELRKGVSSDLLKGDLVFTLFGDYGYSLTNKTMLSTDKVSSVHLAGHGVGINYQTPSGTFMRLSIAQRVGKYTPAGDPEDRLPRIYFSLNKPL